MFVQALEEGEDLDEFAVRSRDKKDKRVTNKLLKDASASGRATPISDTDSRGRKNKKGKSRMNVPDYEPLPTNGKRKRGMQSMSVTPSVIDDDDDDRDSVCTCASVLVLRNSLGLYRNDGR
jgi:ATP-dependent helicase STH1/SNF2